MTDGVRFDWSINLGTLIHLAGLLIGGTVLYMKLTGRMKSTEQHVARLYVWVRELIRHTPGVDATVIASANSDPRDK